MEEQLLRVEATAKILGLSPSTIRKMLWDGRLRRIKIGRATRVRKQEIDDLILYGYEPQRSIKERQGGIVSRKKPKRAEAATAQERRIDQ